MATWKPCAFLLFVIAVANAFTSSRFLINSNAPYKSLPRVRSRSHLAMLIKAGDLVTAVVDDVGGGFDRLRIQLKVNLPLHFRPLYWSQSFGDR